MFELQTHRYLTAGIAIVFTLTLILFTNQNVGEAQNHLESDLIPIIAPGSAYRQRNLLSDVPGLAPVLDPVLVNPWGISIRGTSPFWVANNGTSTTQLIRGDVAGAPVTLNPGLSTVTIPGGLPTGTVGNATTDFVLPGACAAPPCAALFLFSSITGNIVGWNPNAPAAGSTTGVIAASHPGHVYTGLAFANNGVGNFIYAADFANGRIDVFNASFALQPLASFPFADPTIPTTMGNTYHPFNIQNIGGSLYVAYAKVGPDGRDEQGVGNGFVRRFNANGVRDLTFGINNGALNSPWGITIAPPTFGIFGGALLVGNFGDSNPSIHAYNPTTGAFLGTLQDESGNGIVIEELWDLKFGNGGNGGDVNTLYFAAGPGEEEHGLFGKLNPTTASATSLIQFADSEFSINEGAGHIDVTITRIGDASNPATVSYNTFDQSQPDHASQKSDFEIALGSVSFAPGETSKTFRILLVNDLFDETNEVIDLYLSNVTGTLVGLGSPNAAEMTIIDNDVGPPATNPYDDAGFFVRQHYLDFLNREPDPAGLAFWTNEITSCGAVPACIESKRVSVSAAFFLSIEFQATGYLAYLTHRAAFGPNASFSSSPVLYGNFMRDVQALQRGYSFGAPGAEPVLEANKVAYFNEFVTRPEFVAKYPSTLTNEQYVDNLLLSANLSPNDFIVNMTNSQEVPPANPTTTGGLRRNNSYGTTRFVFNAALTTLTLTSTVSNIDFTGLQTADTNDNLTNAHIHAGAAVTPGVNGPVVFGFIGTPFNDNNPNDVVVTPAVGGVGGTVTSKWDAPEGQNTTLAAQLDNLRAGRAYINFHTSQFGGGEIRGNMLSLAAFRDALVSGLNGGTLTRATVLRAVGEADPLEAREFNAAFVTMQYFGYLRRDSDTAGFNFWFKKLNDFGGNFVAAEMVRAFITSLEDRQRFGVGFGPFQEISKAILDRAYDYEPTPFDVPTSGDGEIPPTTKVPATPDQGETPIIKPDEQSLILAPPPASSGIASFPYAITESAQQPSHCHTPEASTKTETVAQPAPVVSLAGRLYDSTGAYLSNIEVNLSGPGINRTVTTDSSGGYRFAKVPVGQAYTITVKSKTFTFDPKVVLASDSLTDMDLVAQP